MRSCGSDFLLLFRNQWRCRRHRKPGKRIRCRGAFNQENRYRKYEYRYAGRTDGRSRLDDFVHLRSKSKDIYKNNLLLLRLLITCTIEDKSGLKRIIRYSIEEEDEKNVITFLRFFTFFTI